jgi:hypothetical protein
MSCAISAKLGKREQHWVRANGTYALAACFDAILASKNCVYDIKMSDVLYR